MIWWAGMVSHYSCGACTDLAAVCQRYMFSCDAHSMCHTTAHGASTRKQTSDFTLLKQVLLPPQDNPRPSFPPPILSHNLIPILQVRLGSWHGQS